MAYDKVVDSGVLDGKLTAIADAIRGKTGKTEEMTLDQMATEIAAIEAGGGGSDLFLEINNNTLINFVATEEMLKLRDEMLYGNTALKSADLSKLGAPWNSSKNNWDTARMIAKQCFENCTGLETVVLPEKCEQGGSWLYANAFKGCTGLKEFCTEYPCGWNTQCGGVFQNCTALERAIIPNFTGNGFSGSFSGCTALEIVDCSPSAVQANCFANCTALMTVIIRSTSMANLGNVNAFNNTPFASGGTGGTVYVPSALIESYQTATNWSTLYAAGTCNFVAIEGSEYE